MIKTSTLLIVSFIGAFLLLCSNAQGTKCCVCSDGCVSTITKPDVTIPLPANPLLPAGVSEASCEMIRNFAEDLQLIPPEYCSTLDVEEFRVKCGCEVSFVLDFCVDEETGVFVH